MVDGKSFAEIFNEEKKNSEKSFRELSELLHISHGTLAKYSSGVAHPSVKVLQTFCKIFKRDFKTIYLLIQSEKAPSTTKRFFIERPALYPKLRNTLLNLYIKKREDNSRESIQRELEKYDVHIIESALVMIANGIGKRTDDFLPSIKHFPKEGSEKIVKKKIISWSYNIYHGILTVKFYDSNNSVKDNKVSILVCILTMGFKNTSPTKSLNSLKS